MLARQEIRKEIAMFSKETTPPPVAGYRLDNMISIACFRTKWNMHKIITRHKLMRRAVL